MFSRDFNISLKYSGTSSSDLYKVIKEIVDSKIPVEVEEDKNQDVESATETSKEELEVLEKIEQNNLNPNDEDKNF